MYKETDLTNITCNKCQTPIAYETVSFQGSNYGTSCSIGLYHPTHYAIKCSKCNNRYGPWNKFDLSLFPNFPDPDKCPCRYLCNICGYNRKSEECGHIVRNDIFYYRPRKISLWKKIKNRIANIFKE